MIILVINVGNVLGEVRINEIHATTIEFVEIYNSNNENLNLSEWKIKDEQENDTITCYNIPNCSLITNVSYFIIIGNNTNISNITLNEIIYFRISDNNIGNNLNDLGDNISFFNSTFSTNVSYSPDTKKLSWQYCPGIWLERNPTPGFLNNCSSSTNTSTPSTPAPELSLDMTWNEDEIINGLEKFDIDVIAKNLDDEENYDVKVWIEFEDNNTIISQTYDENDTWVSSDEYYNQFFENEINKTKSITLRIKDNYKTYHGDAIIKLILRKVGSSSYIEEISKDIIILEKDEDNNTTEQTEQTSQEIIATNSSQIKTIKLGSSLETINKTNLKTNNPIIYESSNERIKKYAVFGFAGLCLIITILALFNKLN